MVEGRLGGGKGWWSEGMEGLLRKGTVERRVHEWKRRWRGSKGLWREETVERRDIGVKGFWREGFVGGQFAR